jgi:hypothetical protein
MKNRRVLAVAGFMALAAIRAPAALAAEANADVTLRARAILHKYCAECHHPGPGASGEISVLDRAGLERADRPFLAPGSADASQLLQLIEDGSMPPGNHAKPTAEERKAIRDWINADAAAYPRDFDDQYVLSSILADIQRLTEAERPHVRYFSLHNLIPDADPAFQLEARRQALRQAIADHSINKQARVEPIDPVQSVFRVSLRRAETGWESTPFERQVKVDGKSKAEPSKVNLFDVILIEYPLGRSYSASPTYKQLTDQFLKPANQVVPIAFVRGDWFGDEFCRSVVGKEIRYALELPDLPASDSTPAAAVAAAGKAEGTAIIPLDSTLKRDYAPSPLPFHLMFETHDPKTDLPKTKFKTGERFTIYIRPDRRIFFDLIYTAADGKCAVIDPGTHFLIDADQEKKLSPANVEGYRITGEATGKEYLTIFASEKDFPRGGSLLRTTLLYDRVIHPFYTLPGTATDSEFDPAKIVKKTIVLETRPQ